MSITITLKEGHIGPWLMRFSERVTPRRLTRVASRRYFELILRHLREDVANRHTTASRLGATPTGHWANPTTYTQLNDQGSTAEITINKPGIARAIRDVTLRPKRGKALTLPLHALAYGRRPAEFVQNTGMRLFRPQKSRILAATDASGKLTPIYLLSGAAFQKRDPTLLPGDETITQALHDALTIELEASALEAANHNS